MAERNKLLAVLIVGLLVGFGVGRLVSQSNLNEEGESVVADLEKDATQEEGNAITIEEILGQEPQVGSQLSAGVAGALKKTALDRLQVTKDDAMVSVFDQIAQDQVLVSGVVTSSPVWVAVHANRDGVPGNVFGARLVSASDTEIIVSLLRPTESGSMYYVVLQEDNGNNIYDLYLDKEIVDARGNLVTKAFMAQ